MSKYPRNRLTQASYLAQSFSHLPPPAYGNSIGHGVNFGYNPEKPEKVK